MKTYLTFLLAFFCFTIHAQDFTLDGNLIIGDDNDKSLEVTGDTRIDGGLKLPALSSSGNLYPNLLHTDQNGNVLRLGSDGVEDLLLSLYAIDCKGGMNNTAPVWKNDVNRLFVKDACVPSPRVGIDIANPMATFHVVGNSIISTIENPDLSLFTNQQLLMYSQGSNTYDYGLRIASDDDDYNAISLSDAITGSDKFRLMGNGNIFATKVSILEFDNFPDYVFEDDYKLMPLFELEKYIDKNKHLPNMPSSTEVKENGADMGELLRLLTEKVEELTLHTIEQEKKIQALEKELTDKN